jgi:hypothetical protein
MFVRINKISKYLIRITNNDASSSITFEIFTGDKIIQNCSTGVNKITIRLSQF